MEWVTEEAWQQTASEVRARGSVARDFPIPSNPAWDQLTGQSKAWAHEWVRSGGDARAANSKAGYQTPSHLTALRFLKGESPPVARMRTFIVALNESLKSQPYEPEVKQEPVEAPLVLEPEVVAIQTQPEQAIEQPPVYVPSLIPSEIVDVNEGEKDTEKAKKIWRNAASHTPGDFMILERDESNAVVDWRWDLEALAKAPAGVLKGLGRDGKGRTTVEFTDATQSAKLLADHWKPKENEGGRIDIRSVVVNILQAGDPAERYRLDDLARKAAERLKADREKKQLAG